VRIYDGSQTKLKKVSLKTDSSFPTKQSAVDLDTFEQDEDVQNVVILFKYQFCFFFI